MDDEPDVSYCCIRESRCRLCQFGLEIGDSVVAYIDGGQRLSCLGFHPYESHEDHSLHIRFHTCRSGCHLGDFCAPLFHSGCFEFQQRLHPVTPRLLAATAYSFRPSSYETRRRSDLIQSRLLPKLPLDLPVRLPAEIHAMIAKLLVRECAVVTAQEQLLGDALPPEFNVDLTRDVYARYCELDGISYIKSLGNSKSETDKKDVLLLRAQEEGAIHKILISEDHLGIRSVHFASSSRILMTSPRPGLWWKCISRRDGIAKIRVATDTSKFRDITDPDVDPAPENCIHWAAPDHPTYIIHLGTFRRPSSCPKRLPMSYFDCNAPGTTGYSVATDGVCIATIHTHIQGDDSLGFYKDVDPSFHWIFMPLDEAEHLTEICRRYGRCVGIDAFGIMFTTNRGRHAMFGCYTPRPERIDLTRIFTPLPTVSRFWFNVWDSVPERDLRYVAFDESLPPIKRPYPRSLMPNIAFPGTQSNEPWLFSCCSMKGVAEITICQDVSLGHRHIIGMQLEYIGGHRACVGQFRFDMDLRTIRVDGARALYIGSRATKQRFKYVADVTATPPADDGGELIWTAFHWDEKLEWWFSSRHCIIRKTCDTER